MSKDVRHTLTLTLAPGFMVERGCLFISSACSSVARCLCQPFLLSARLETTDLVQGLVRLILFGRLDDDSSRSPNPNHHCATPTGIASLANTPNSNRSRSKGSSRGLQAPVRAFSLLFSDWKDPSGYAWGMYKGIYGV